jgi:hypothetical protein
MNAKREEKMPTNNAEKINKERREDYDERREERFNDDYHISDHC